MSHCVCCDSPLLEDEEYVTRQEGPFCFRCYETAIDNQQRKQPMHASSITATEDESIQAVIDRAALRIPTVNTVIFAGRLRRAPLMIGGDMDLTAMFQVANDDPFNPAQAEVLMRGPAAEFCRELFAGQAVVVHGRLDKKIPGERGTRIVASFIEPLQ